LHAGGVPEDLEDDRVQQGTAPAAAGSGSGTSARQHAVVAAGEIGANHDDLSGFGD
jgi:hypothetical protein